MSKGLREELREEQNREYLEGKAGTTAESINVDVTRGEHIRLRYLPEGACYLFFDNEDTETVQVVMRFSGSETMVSRERFHRIRQAIDAFDDRLTSELGEG